jgi:hypothetical protein
MASYIAAKIFPSWLRFSNVGIGFAFLILGSYSFWMLSFGLMSNLRGFSIMSPAAGAYRLAFSCVWEAVGTTFSTLPFGLLNLMFLAFVVAKFRGKVSLTATNGLLNRWWFMMVIEAVALGGIFVMRTFSDRDVDGYGEPWHMPVAVLAALLTMLICYRLPSVVRRKYAKQA